MPETEIRRAVVANRREGRRSLSAYGSHARGLRAVAGDHGVLGLAKRRSRPAHAGEAPGGWSAGAALALVYSLFRRMRSFERKHSGTEVGLPLTSGGEGAGRMTRKPTVKSLQNVSLEEATAYLDYFAGDELDAAYALAWDSKPARRLAGRSGRRRGASRRVPPVPHARQVPAELRRDARSAAPPRRRVSPVTVRGGPSRPRPRR